MNEQERTEFEWLKARQKRLEGELSHLAAQIERLERKIKEPQAPTLISSEPSPIPAPRIEPTPIGQTKLPEKIQPVPAPGIEPSAVATPRKEESQEKAHPEPGPQPAPE